MMPGASAGTRMEAPGASRYDCRMPPAEPAPKVWPNPSDYAVEPESGLEMLDGEVREALPAGPKHARQHAQVDFVLRAYAAPGYGADSDLLTRQAVEHNFASDTCIRKNGVDPDTGDRYLEELAFEIKSTQSGGNFEKRARIMATRGVRRVFAIPVRGDPAGSDFVAGPVAEWIAAEERWKIYHEDDLIVDPCLCEPLPVRALLDAASADEAVACVLLHKRNRVLTRYGDMNYRAGADEGQRRGEERAAREHIAMILEARGMPVDAATRARIDACGDPALLKRWVVRAATVTSPSELFD